MISRFFFFLSAHPTYHLFSGHFMMGRIARRNGGVGVSAMTPVRVLMLDCGWAQFSFHSSVRYPSNCTQAKALSTWWRHKKNGHRLACSNLWSYHLIASMPLLDHRSNWLLQQIIENIFEKKNVLFCFSLVKLIWRRDSCRGYGLI